MFEKRLNRSVERVLVQKAVVQHMNKKTGRFSFDAFLTAFSEIKKLFPEEQQQKVPIELGERFLSAAHPDKQLPIIIARAILEVLFEESGGESRLSFKRKREEWIEEEVDELMKQHAVDDSMIEEDGFIEVGMIVLFDVQWPKKSEKNGNIFQIICNPQ
ncbi:hypothetical protein FGB62_285g010 [Gracilaria domingensis]|nr:hypothetical protein FGB62_285g010 [Gracilaria domingensis]